VVISDVALHLADSQPLAPIVETRGRAVARSLPRSDCFDDALVIEPRSVAGSATETESWQETNTTKQSKFVF
jgi:hypothetical protein